MVWEGYYTDSSSQDITGGIKSLRRGGGFNKNWWAERWFNIFENFHIGRALTEGKRYAQEGRVSELDVEMGIVTAQVQETPTNSHYVSLEIPLIPENQWEDLKDLLSEHAVYGASLLAGRMPPQIENCFEKVGATLLPENPEKFQTHCSCSESNDPCQHITAVYYLLGEQFDRDPFLMFKLRGADRDRFLSGIQSTRSKTNEGQPSTHPATLPSAPSEYWTDFKSERLQYPSPSIPPRPAELPNRLGPFPFWRSQTNFLRKLEILYQNAAGRALRITDDDEP